MICLRVFYRRPFILFFQRPMTILLRISLPQILSTGSCCIRRVLTLDSRSQSVSTFFSFFVKSFPLFKASLPTTAKLLDPLPYMAVVFLLVKVNYFSLNCVLTTPRATVSWGLFKFFKVIRFVQTNTTGFVKFVRIRQNSNASIKERSPWNEDVGLEWHKFLDLVD